MKIISVREEPNYSEKAIAYFQSNWATESTMIVYEDCIKNAILTKSPLPQWYLLEDNGEIIGGAGLITNDFISRMDLYPWICALFIEPSYRGSGLGFKLIEKAKEDAKKADFRDVYLCTDHIGYYEKAGFVYIGDGYHPWGERSRIYKHPV